MSWIDQYFQGYTTVQAGGSALVQRPNLNFKTGASVTDNPLANSTDVNISVFATPSGTGFPHITSGGVDPTARAVNVATADITGVLPYTSGGTGLSTVGTNGYVLTVVSGAPAWAPSSGGGSSVTGTGLWFSSSGTLNAAAITLTGDITQGSLTSNNLPLTVNSIRGVPVSNTAPSAANLLVYSGSAWTPVSMSGDASLSSAGALTLHTVNSNVGTFGDSTHVAQVTVNGKGLITAVSSVAIAGGTSVTGTGLWYSASGSLNSAAIGFSGDATFGALSGGNVPITFATVNSNVGTFGSTTQIGTFTVNEKGLITAASNVSLAAAGLPTITLTGDVTGAASGGSVATTLATVNSNVGTFGDSSHVAQVTVNAKGLITAVSNVAIAGGTSVTGTGLWYNVSGSLNSAAITLTGDVSQGALSVSNVPLTVTALQGHAVSSSAPSSANILVYSSSTWTPTAVSGDASLSSAGAVTLATVNSNVGTFGSTTQIGTFTVNGKGLITAASNVSLAAAGLPTITLTGDTTGSGSGGAITTTTSKVNGVSYPAGGSLTTGNGPHVSGVSAVTYSALNLAGGSGWVTGQLPVGNLANGTAAQLLVTNSGATAPAWVTMSGDSTLSAAGALTLATVNSNVGTFGDSTHVAQVTVDGKGRITAVSNVAISGGNSVTGTGLWYSSSGTLNSAAITLTGDVSQGALSGSSVPLTVTALQGHAVSSSAPSSSQILIYGSSWVPQSVSGDVSLTSGGVTNVLSLTGNGGNLNIAGTAQSFNFAVTAIPTFTNTAAASTSSMSGNWGNTFTITAQAGQAATGATHNGGSGGNLILQGGTGGTSGSATGGAGGSVGLVSGAGVGGNLAGGITLETGDYVTKLQLNPGVSGSLTMYTNSGQNFSLSSSGVLTLAGYSTTGLAHMSSLGVISSSLLVDADVSSSAAIAVSKLAAGTNTYVLTTVSGVPTWQSPSAPSVTGTGLWYSSSGTLNSAAVTFTGDVSLGLLSSPNVSTSVVSLSGSGGTIPIAITGSVFTWNSGTSSPGMTQTAQTVGSGTGAVGQTLSITSQAGQGTGSGTGGAGGPLTLTAGAGGAGSSGGYSNGGTATLAGGAGGAASGVGSGTGGAVVLQAGAGSGTSGPGGSITINTGARGGTGPQGTIALQINTTPYLTVTATGGIKFNALGTGIGHIDSSGNLTSSAITTGELPSNIPVANLAAGTNTFVLTSVSGVPTWQAPSGGSSATGTGLWYSASGTLNAAAVTLTGDLTPSALSGNNLPVSVVSLTGASGTIPIASTGNVFTWAAATTAPGITQTQAVSGAGAAMSISSQQGASGSAGGALSVTGGAGGGSNSGGGNLNLTGGAATGTGASGQVIIAGGTTSSTGVTVAGAAVSVTGGAGSTGAGSGTNGGAGAAVTVTGGTGGTLPPVTSSNPVSGAGGNLTLNGGAGGNFSASAGGSGSGGTGGTVTITGGVGGVAQTSNPGIGGNGGGLTLAAGAGSIGSTGTSGGNGGNGGDASLSGGNAANGNNGGGRGGSGGNLTLAGGNAATTNGQSSNTGGTVAINGGSAGYGGTAGSINLTAGAGNGSSTTTSGSVNIAAGATTTTSGTAGSVNIIGGQCSTGTAGHTVIRGGTATNALGAAGSVFLYTGVNTGGSGATGSLNFIVYYAGVSSLTQMTCTANGWALANGTVTLAATGTTTLTAAQKATPNLIMSTVTLTGGVTLALNGVVGTYDIDFGAVTVGAQTVTITNGAGSFTATTLLATKTLLHVVCNTSNTLAVG